VNRWGKLALGVAVVLAIGIWDVGLPHSHPGGVAATSSSPAASARPSPTPILPSPVPQAAPGVLQPTGHPEFTASFTGSSLDTKTWDTCYPWLSQAGCMNFGNLGHEDEWYLPSQVQVSGGALHLVAQQQPTAGKTSNGSPQEYACRSGMVTTYPSFNFEYGYIQIVARIPLSAGLWPALWLAASNFQWPPEMDILEAWGGPQLTTNTYFHYVTSAGNKYIKAEITPATRAVGWHSYALSWTPTQLTWLVDGQPVMTTTQYVPHQNMYFIADLGEWVTPAQPNVLPGQCDGSFDIRSVTVWPATPSS
jgi:beta-glucanase (GH16 family)